MIKYVVSGVVEAKVDGSGDKYILFHILPYTVTKNII